MELHSSLSSSNSSPSLKMLEDFLEYFTSRQLIDPIHRVQYKISQRKIGGSYKPTTVKSKIIVLHHKGLGDHLTMIGAVRYLSMCYDKLILCVHPRNVQNVRQIYSDDDSIELLPVNVNCSDTDLSFLGPYAQQGYKVLKIGHCFDPALSFTNHFYRDFYRTCGLDYNTIRAKFSFMNRNLLRELALYNNIPDKNYVFVHDSSLIPQVKTLTRLPIITPQDNVSMLDYSTIMERAKMLVLLDSSFFCLATILDTSQVSSKHVFMRWYMYNDYPNVGDKWTYHELYAPAKTSPKKNRFGNRHKKAPLNINKVPFPARILKSQSPPTRKLHVKTSPVRRSLNKMPFLSRKSLPRPNVFHSRPKLFHKTFRSTMRFKPLRRKSHTFVRKRG